jgi:serine/threonine-protein kinase
MTAARCTMTPGELVDGRYRIDQVLHVGRAETVASACRLEGRGRVAIRFQTAAAAASSEGRERWLTELRSARQLNSPCIAQVLDVAEECEIPYTVSEYVEGCPLDLLLSSGTVEDPDAIGWISETCGALALAHERGLVHRDLTPASLSVVRGRDGRRQARLLGLGTSRLLLERSPLADAAPGELPLYSAPEVVSDTASEEGVSTNVWSLGVMLYELLTGTVPFSGVTAQSVQRAVLMDQPIRPTALASNIPAAMEATVLRCLEKLPSRRTASAAALQSELTPFMARRTLSEPARVGDDRRTARARPSVAPRNRRRAIVIL